MLGNPKALTRTFIISLIIYVFECAITALMKHAACRNHYKYQMVPTSLERLAVLQGLVAGLSSMHARGYIHHDLKPENVLIQPRQSWYPVQDEALHPKDVRLGDFGLATYLKGDEEEIDW